MFSTPPLEAELASIKQQPLYIGVVLAHDVLMRTHQSQNESLGVQEAELAKAQADRKAEIDSINHKYDAMCQDIVNKHNTTNEMWTHNVSMATQAYEEIRVRLQGELERISACKLVGCGVEDVIMVAASTGARPDAELMKK